MDYKLQGSHSVFGRVAYEDDRFSGFDYQIDSTLGYNRLLLESDGVELKGAIGAGFRVSEFETGGSESEVIVRFAGDFVWHLSTSATFRQMLSTEIGPESTITRSETSLSTDILSNLAMKLSLNIKHQSEVPVDRVPVSIMEFVDITIQDFGELLALNESCVPHVNSIGVQDLEEFKTQAYCFSKLCDADNCLMGFVIALQPGQSYDSVNYRWFERKFESFLYIDRIMVHRSFRRRGLATRIYHMLENLSVKAGVPRLCCEVNINPPNPDSQKLHDRLGFGSVGTLLTQNGKKEVNFLTKMLSAGKQQ